MSTNPQRTIAAASLPRRLVASTYHGFSALRPTAFGYNFVGGIPLQLIWETQITNFTTSFHDARFLTSEERFKGQSYKYQSAIVQRAPTEAQTRTFPSDCFARATTKRRVLARKLVGLLRRSINTTPSEQSFIVIDNGERESAQEAQNAD